MKFRKKSIVIEAVQLRWDTWSEMCDLAGVGSLAAGKPEGCYLDVGSQPFLGRSKRPSEDRTLGLKIPTLEGLMIAREGDWIVKGVKGELYPVKDDIFQLTYERCGPDEPDLLPDGRLTLGDPIDAAKRGEERS